VRDARRVMSLILEALFASDGRSGAAAGSTPSTS
jgi:hypothetical protein